MDRSKDTRLSGTFPDPKLKQSPFVCFFRGLADAVNIVTPIKCIYGSEQVRDDAMNCLVMNGFIFLGVMKLFQLVIDPFFSSCPEDEELWSCLLGGTSFTKTNLDVVRDSGLIPIHRWFFNIFFVVPLFILSKIVSNFFFQDIADAGFALMQKNQTQDEKKQQLRLKQARAARSGGGMRATLLAGIADLIFSILMQLILLIEIVLISLGPGPCPYVAFVYSAWLFSLYCFEYTWINRGWGLNERIEYFESGWIYFLGFGTPYALISLNVDFFTGAALTQLLFPAFVLIAVQAEPVQSNIVSRIPICREARLLTNRLMKFLPSQQQNR